MKIAHLGDIHIRFSSRHEEYREVFERLYKDLKSQKPDRIVIGGDLNHQKVNMSPGSLDLSTEFLINLAEIAPVDLILGNHDINLSQKEQGDTISPMFKIVKKLSKLLPPSTKKHLNRLHIVNKENASEIDFNKKGMYFFPDSDFYKINENLVYGVYSCKDDKMLTLKKKEKDVNYIALYHGQLYGARLDNGYETFGDNLLNPETFNNFDIVMLSDIHEFQTFREDDTMAYCGSLIQQNNGESIDKGYLLWDVENKTFQRRLILNDYGFAKISIAKGEIIEERIDNIKYSNDKKKTKVYIIWEDYEENYSTEKESQIARLVKEKHGCEVVKVSFSAIEKEEKENTDVEDAKDKETFIDQLTEYVDDVESDFDENMKAELIDFARNTDDELEIQEKNNEVRIWDIEEIEISNVFSFGEKAIKFPMHRYKGITGIFGKNYSGKSNVIKAIVWGLYQHILGGGDSKKIINIYTSSNKGYVKIILTIDGEKFRISRHIVTSVNKHGKSTNNYPVKYEKLVIDDNNKKSWKEEISDRTATQKVEVKKLIIDAIGTVEDFTKVSLQSQDGSGGYLNQKQQPKNDLINRYMGLEFFRDRYAYGNEFLKEVKRKQKSLGNIVEIEGEIVELEAKIKSLKVDVANLTTLKEDSETKKEKVDKKIIKLSSSLKVVEKINPNEFETKEEINIQIKKVKDKKAALETKKKELEDWLAINFKKELNIDPNTTMEGLTKKFNDEDKLFQNEKLNYQSIEKWLKNNPKLELVNIAGFDKLIQDLNADITSLKAKLPTYKGEKCPTCGHVTQIPNPQMYQQCSEEISQKQGAVNTYNQSIKQYNSIIIHNQNVDKQEINLANLRNSLLIRKNTKDDIKKTIDLFIKSESIISHNAEVESKSKELIQVKNDIDTQDMLIKNLEENFNKIIKNKDAKKHNEKIEKELELCKDQVKGYKFTIYNFGQQIIQKSGDLRIEINNLENYNKKYEEVVKEERKYKIYSFYLQAVHRDGIPARIIRKKLPIVNNKINSILSSIVDFQIQLSVLSNGDIIEEFYFSEDKSDLLPLSSASGSQKFISSLVIKDALHYISNLIKPSINIIDEGFGTLDDELTSGIVNVLYYLKNKYKNVLVITHRNEIKDFVDNIIEAYKDSSEIDQEVLDNNLNAGITKLNII